MLTCKAYQILSAGPHQLPLDVPTDLPTQDFGSADRVWTNLKTILVLSLYYRLHYPYNNNNNNNNDNNNNNNDNDNSSNRIIIIFCFKKKKKEKKEKKNLRSVQPIDGPQRS